MAKQDTTPPDEPRDALWPRMVGLGLVFLFLLAVGVVTVWVPELRNDPEPEREGAARPADADGPSD